MKEVKGLYRRSKVDGCFIEQVLRPAFHCRWFRHAALVEKGIATFIGLISQGPAHAPPLLR